MNSDGLESRLRALFSTNEPEQNPIPRAEHQDVSFTKEIAPEKDTSSGVLPPEAVLTTDTRKSPQARKRPQSRSRPILGIVAAIVVVFLATGSLRLLRTSGNTDPPKETVAVFVGTLSAQVSASGQVLPQHEAKLAFGIIGRIEHIYVKVGDEVHAGDVLAQLESDVLQRAVQAAEQNLVIQEATLAELQKSTPEEDISAAEAAVASAQAQLEDLLAGASDKELAAAEASLTSAQDQLDTLLSGPGDKELAYVKAALASARATESAEAARYAAIGDQLIVARRKLDLESVDLESAQYFYDALKNDWQHADYADFSPEAEKLQDAQSAYSEALAEYNLALSSINDNALRNARAQVALAEADLAALTEVKSAEIAQAHEQVALAQANLAALTRPRTAQIAAARAQLTRAKANLANLLEGASSKELATAQTHVEQAKIQLADAQARLAKAALTAPSSGTVTAIHADVGELAGSPIIEIVDVDSLQVVLDVDEVDVVNIEIGQETIVTLEMWPDHELAGRVVAIGPKATVQSRIVSYPVHISLDPDGLPIRNGMTVDAVLTTSYRENVLLVSNRAIVADRESGRYYVHRIKEDSVEKVEIVIGLRDRTYSEITSGLEEGDELAVGYGI